MGLSNVFCYLESSDDDNDEADPTQSKSTQSKSTQSKSTQSKSTQSKKKKEVLISDDEYFDDLDYMDEEALLDEISRYETRSKSQSKARIIDQNLEDANESFKRLLSTASESDNKRLKACLTEAEFIVSIPKWGGFFKDENGHTIALTNTCTIDYFLLAIWTASRLNDSIPTSDDPFYFTTKQIIHHIDNHEWNHSKKIFVTDILKLKPQSKRKKYE